MWGSATKRIFQRHMKNMTKETTELGMLEWMAVPVLCHQSGLDDVITPWGVSSVVDLLHQIMTPLRTLKIGRIYILLLSCCSREDTLQQVTRQTHMAQVEIVCYKRSVTIEAALEQTATLLRTMVNDPARLRKRVTFFFFFNRNNTSSITLHTAARI